MRIFHQSRCCLGYRLTAGFSLLFLTALTSFAQSTNIEFPTPVGSNQVSGVIEARDIGDARLTRHYYLLAGTQGDLILTVESNNLNGDVDLFTAGSLRPMTKLSMFSGISTTSSSKSIFLRQRETLILRVEARSASDEAGSYRIRFSGGFEPVAGSGAATEADVPTVSQSRTGDRKVRRVNSAGARINEPLPDIAESRNPSEVVPPATVEAEKTEAEEVAESRSRVEPAPTKAKTTRPVRTAKPKPPARSTRRRSTATAKKTETQPTAPAATGTVPSATAPAEPVFNPRLIIETRDGVRVERYMSEVRRVTVEKGQLIVITIDGRIERRPMTTVLRVAIEP